MRQEIKTPYISRFSVATLVIFLVTACGGSGDNSASPPPPPPANTAPTADAGSVQNVISGEIVILSGSGSDVEAGSLSYDWVQTAGPLVILLDASTPQPSLIAPYTGDETYEFELIVTDSGGLSASSTTSVSVTVGIVGCTVDAPPATFGLDSFHAKYCDANGIPVTSSIDVADRALEDVAEETRRMTSMRPDVLLAAVNSGLRIVIRAEGEVLTDIPELADLYQRFPGTDFDASLESEPCRASRYRRPPKRTYFAGIVPAILTTASVCIFMNCFTLLRTWVLSSLTRPGIRERRIFIIRLYPVAYGQEPT